MQEIKRTISLKEDMTKAQEAMMKGLFDRYSHALTSCLSYIDSIHENHIPIDKRGKCSKCGNDMDLKFQYKHSQETRYCQNCFSRKWSWQTLTLVKSADGYMKDLQENFPELAKHKGYYAGVIKYSYQIYKSYQTKKEERELEIQRLRQIIESTHNPEKQLELRAKLEQKERGIKKLHFKGNVVYLGNASMFDFKKEGNRYFLGISNPDQLRDKIWIKLNLGDRGSYHTDHNKYEILDKNIENKEHKKLFGKLLKRKKGKTEVFEFMFPKRDISESLEHRDDIKKLFDSNPGLPVIALTFGVKRPVVLAAFIEGKLAESKDFGDGSFFAWINRQRAYRAKVNRAFARRYGQKRIRNRHRRKFVHKRFKMEAQHIKSATHKLTTEIARYISGKYPGAIIIMQDSKGLKRISYPGIYRTVLDRWNISMQKTMLEYKLMLRHHHIFKVRYSESNNLECSKCGHVFKNGKEHIKNTTIKLIHGLDREGYYKHRYKMLQNKILALFKYPATRDLMSWIRQTSAEATMIKDKIKEYGFTDDKDFFVKYSETFDREKQERLKNKFKQIKCEKCGHSSDFYLNDAACLYNRFRNHAIEAKAKKEQPGQAPGGSGLSSMPLEAPV